MKLVLLTGDVLNSTPEDLAKVIAKKSLEAAGDIIIIIKELEDVTAAHKDCHSTIEKLQEENKNLLGLKADLMEINASLEKEIEKLSSATPAIKEEASSVVNLDAYGFEFDGQAFGFNYFKQMVKGQPITAVEVMADGALQAHLIATNSSMIKKK